MHLQRIRLPVLFLQLLTIAVQADARKATLYVKLAFTPQENIPAPAPDLSGTAPARPLTLVALSDARETDRTLIGENVEDDDRPVPVRTNTHVADFVTEALRTCLTQWGVRLTPNTELLLKGELVRIFVKEENRYNAEVAFRFRLEDRAGQVVWEGVVPGAASTWGSSLSAENYNETISDALKKAYAGLLSNRGFQAAWTGRKTIAESVKPAALKEAVLRLMKEGLGEEAIASYVRTKKVSPPLTAEEMIEWKRANIPELVIRAALEVPLPEARPAPAP